MRRPSSTTTRAFLVLSCLCCRLAPTAAIKTTTITTTSSRTRRHFHHFHQHLPTTAFSTTKLTMSTNTNTKNSKQRPSPEGRVAIVGAGISGLACAKELKALGLDPYLFDTGRLHPGGRCSSKTLKVEGKQAVMFDHSAQFLSSATAGAGGGASSSFTDGTWEKWIEQMEAQGILREWSNDRIGTLTKGGHFTSRSSTSPPPPERALIPASAEIGMHGIPLFLAQGLPIDRPKWISKAKINQDGTWRLWHYQEQLADFEYLVIAHNGKCAARLMKSPGEALAPVQRLLETKFGSKLRTPTPKYMQLCSLFVLMVVLEGPVRKASDGPVFEGAFVNGVPEISWVADQGLKLQQQQHLMSEGGKERSAWVIVSSPGFAEANKVPQENIPKEKEAEVTQTLLRAFYQAMGLSSSSQGDTHTHTYPKPVTSKLQLWGAGNPISVLDIPRETPFIFQGTTNCGVCGDWLLAPSIPAAAESGIKLAQHIAKHHAAKKEGGASSSSSSILSLDVGLEKGFKPVKGARPIVAFPGEKVKEEVVVYAANANKRPPQQGGGGGGGGGKGRGGGGGKPRSRNSKPPPAAQQQQQKQQVKNA